MPYAADWYRVVVTGNLNGGEVWANTWTIHEDGGPGSLQDAVDALHEFYEDLFGFATPVADSTTAVRATARHLADDEVFEMVWGSLAGASAANPLPNQLAVRVSLSAGSVRGGPYLPGLTVSVLDAEGNLSAGFVGDLVGALEEFTGSLTALGWELGIDQPSVPQAVPVTSGRVGERLDVIRKRANDQAEGYSAFSIA